MASAGSAQEHNVLEPGQVRDLRRRMRRRSLRYEDLEAALDILDQGPRPGVLSGHERAVLGRIGVDPDEAPGTAPGLAGTLSRRELEAASLTTAEAADRGGVDASRIRQRLGERTLLGFHRAGGRHDWLLPAFQFELDLDQLPDLWGRLLQALPSPDDTSPTALVAWLTQPRDHLGGQSRAEGLAAGTDVEQLIAEAATFGMPA